MGDQGNSMEKCLISDWSSGAILHCLSQTSDFNAYSQGHGDLNDDWDPQDNAIAIRSCCDYDTHDVDFPYSQPVQNNSPLSFLLTAIAGYLSMPVLFWVLNLMDFASFGLHESSVQGLDSLHWVAWQTEDQTAVISLKIPRMNICQSQILVFFNWSIIALQCCFRFIWIAEWFRYIYRYIDIDIDMDVEIEIYFIFSYWLLQNIDYSSLCYIVGPCWLSVSYIVVYIC